MMSRHAPMFSMPMAHCSTCMRRLRSIVSSNHWDVMGAASFGFRAMWLNRASMPEEYADQPPMRVVPDLSALMSLSDGRNA